jgi:hypothetical protein
MGHGRVGPLLIPFWSGVSRGNSRTDAAGTEQLFGKPRQSGGSHVIFKMPWPGDPRVNLQNDKGKAKAYQVRQVLLAIDKLKGER